MDFLPLVRFPWRRGDEKEKNCSKAYLDFFGDEVLGVTGFELNKSVVVKNGCLGTVKFAMMITILVGYLGFYCLYARKSYLEMAPVSGVVRMQIQQPVKNCNPLNTGCDNNFKAFSELPYCAQSGSGNSSVACEYMDEFNLIPAIMVDGTNALFLPTRVSYVHQKHLCTNCAQQYTTLNETKKYVADVESFTLLIDHSFQCEDLQKQGAAKDMQGFFRPCLPPHECDLLPLDNLPGVDSFMRERAHLDKVTTQKTRRFWECGEAISTKDAYSLPYGDVFRLGYLLEALGIDLDNMNFENESRRQEGLVLQLEVHYANFKFDSIPNKLPTVYEYRFSLAPMQSYKTVTMNGAGGNQPGEQVDRLVTDWHGVLLRTALTGRMGKASWSKAMLMILETGFVFSLCRWFVRLIALNWFKGVAGDDLENVVSEGYEMNMAEDGKGGKVLTPVSRFVYHEMREQETPLRGSRT
eukprot:gb/GFBE01034401.1/.p1 GENE.gb/GFBE01034401.1/~~gb/GFBE01034401.1/.p1  ORF type:complete len:467 (+),score=76.93 gb/GFBE01034401.1/:1-1401(+)